MIDFLWQNVLTKATCLHDAEPPLTPHGIPESCGADQA